MALITSESTTLIVKGTLASEFRTRFCPTRFTYSLMVGSVTSFRLDSICVAYSLPMRISLSIEYQSQPATLRLPIASTSSLPPLCLAFASFLSLSFFLLSFLSLSLSGTAAGWFWSATGCVWDWLWSVAAGFWSSAGCVVDGCVAAGCCVWLVAGVWVCWSVWANEVEDRLTPTTRISESIKERNFISTLLRNRGFSERTPSLYCPNPNLTLIRFLP